MITLKRTTDYELIRRIVTHPKVYPFVTDDSAPRAEEWRPVEDERIWYVLVEEGEEVLGCFAVAPLNFICWEIHTCLLPNAYGARAKAAGKKLVEFMFQNTGCKRLITNVPSYNRVALRFARTQLTEYGTNNASYQKDGRLYDQVLLGVSKGE